MRYVRIVDLVASDSSISSNHLNPLAVLFPISEVGVGIRATASDACL